MNKTVVATISVIVLVAITLAAIYTINRSQPDGQLLAVLPEYPVREASIGDESYKLLVPQTSDERSIGLAAVPLLPDGYGMLFRGSGQIGIWMQDMRYAIDIIWLGENDEVIHIEIGVRPDSYPQVFVNPENTNARQVIELNSGEVKRIGLEIGEAVKFVDD